ASKHDVGTMDGGKIEALDDVVRDKELRLHADNREAIMEIYDPDEVSGLVKDPAIGGMEQDVVDVLSSGVQKARRAGPDDELPIPIEQVLPQVRHHHEVIRERKYPHLLRSVDELRVLGDE